MSIFFLFVKGKYMAKKLAYQIAISRVRLGSSTEEVAQTQSTTSSVLRPGLSQPRFNLLSERQAAIQSSCQLIYLSISPTGGDTSTAKMSPSSSKPNHHMS